MIPIVEPRWPVVPESPPDPEVYRPTTIRCTSGQSIAFAPRRSPLPRVMLSPSGMMRVGVTTENVSVERDGHGCGARDGEEQAPRRQSRDSGAALPSLSPCVVLRPHAGSDDARKPAILTSPDARP